jgi:hypothetical protein
MARSSKKDSIESISNTKWINKTKVKISWPEELWNWVSSIVKWITDTLFNTLAATYETTMTWASFLSEKLWSEKHEIRENRKAIRKHHANQTKKATNNIWNWIVSIGKWWFHTTKWALRTVLLSWKDTIKSLRDDDSKKKNKKTTKRRTTTKNTWTQKKVA